MIEKSELGKLAEQHAKSQLDELEGDLIAFDFLPENDKKIEVAKSRNEYAKKILNRLLGVAPEIQQINRTGTPQEKQALYAEVVEMLVDRFPILAGEVIRQIAEDENVPEVPESMPVDLSAFDYEALTQPEIDNLPDKVKEALKPFLDLHARVSAYDGADPDEQEIIRDLIQEAFNNVPKVEILKLVVRLKLDLGGFGTLDQKKLIDFLNGIVKKAQAILVPTTVVLPTTPVTSAPANPNLAPKKTGEYQPDPFPEHYNRTTLRNYYFEQFEKAVEEYGDEAAYRYLVRAANTAMTEFLDSGSAQSSSKFGSEFLAMWDTLKDFNPGKVAGQKARGLKIQEWGNKPQKYEKDPQILRRNELARKLFDKGLELLFQSYIAEFAIKHGTPKSLVSNWSHLLEMEKADTDNFGSGIGMFDFFLSDGKERGTGGYKHANVFTYLMWKLPEIIRRIEKTKGSWNDGYPDDHVDALNKAIAAEIGEMRSQVAKKGKHEETVKQHKNPNQQRGRWGVDDANFVFTESDFEELDENDVETKHLIKYISLYGTATGVRQHLFLNDLARGSTPGGAMSDNKEWMVKCSRFALANYQCYKGAVPHPLTEGFEVSWPAKIKDGSPAFNPKQNVIITSILQTESVLNRVMKVRKERVNLGMLQDNEKDQLPDVRFPLETSYPDLYAFVVRAHQKREMGSWVFDEQGNIEYEDEYEYKKIILADGREVVELDKDDKPIIIGLKKDQSGQPIKKKDADGHFVPKRGKKYPAKFETFVAGLNAMDDFVTSALIVPGGVSDKEKIKSTPPSELRKAMLKDLVTLVQTKVSPLKSNEAWVNWRHVAQYILMFVDRMYRVYKLCDDTRDGRAIFTHQIRQTFAAESYNLILAEVPDWITKDKTLVAAREYKKGQAVKVSGLKAQANDPRFAGVAIGESEAAASAERSLDLRDWILSRLPELDDHWSVAIGPKERPLTGAIVGQASGPAIDKSESVQRVRGPVGSAFETKGILALDNLMHNSTASFTNIWHDFVNVGAIPNFQKGIWQVIIGTPAQEQKAVADEKK